jgi:excisionase family DNA binding protein
LRFAKGLTKRRESKFRRKSLLSKDGSIKKRMLGVKELSEYLGLKAQTIYNKISAGTFPIKHRRIGRLLKWDIQDVDLYLDSLPANY